MTYTVSEQVAVLNLDGAWMFEAGTVTPKNELEEAVLEHLVVIGFATKEDSGAEP